MKEASPGIGLGQTIKDHVTVVISGIAVATAACTYGALKVLVIEPAEQAAQRKRLELESVIDSLKMANLDKDGRALEYQLTIDKLKGDIDKCRPASGCVVPSSSLSWKLQGEETKSVIMGDCGSVNIRCDRDSKGKSIYFALPSGVDPSAKVEYKDLSQPPAQGYGAILENNDKIIQLTGAASCGADKAVSVRVRVYKCS
jgi:hypothetical protein